MTSPRRRVTYVLPVHDEVDGIDAFHHALVEATAIRPDLDFEFTYVDDGSRDGSLDRLLALREQDSRVTVTALARNFGHQIAITAGLDLAADADAVVIMDTDLQDPPAVSIQLIDAWEQGADVVYAKRRSRQDPPLKRASASAYYWLLARLTTADIPRDVGDFRLIDRRVVAEVARFREHDRYLRGIIASVGFRQEALLYDRHPRYAGRSSYSLSTMFGLATSGIVGFSTTPLKLISRLGLVISLLSIVLAVYVLGVRVLTPERAVPGWAFLGVGMFLMSGVQLVMMGVIGSYLGRVYVESQNRPLYTVDLVARARSRRP